MRVDERNRYDRFEPTDEGDETIRDGNAIRGLLWGVLFSVPVWAVIVLAVFGLPAILN
ncbi:hypothetical protein [Paenibacillus sp. GYB003]|uniref:hypothetical protein n=1 Tax=Paenibacillus sp. GYB003 TaxID=2994392 RepID=UPI002F96798A